MMFARSCLGLCLLLCIGGGCTSKSKSAGGGLGTGGVAGAGGVSGKAGAAGRAGAAGAGTGGGAGSAGASGGTVIALATLAQSIVEVGGELFWTETGTSPNYTDSRVKSWSSSGGTQVLADTPNGRFVSIIYSNGFLYWTNEGLGTSQGSVERSTVTGLQRKSVATNVTGARGLVAFNSKLYFTRFSTVGEVVEIDGATVTPIFKNQVQPWGITSVGQLYWVTHDQSGALMKGLASGGTPTAIASLDFPGAIAADSTHIYVAHDAGISRFTFSGVRQDILPDRVVNEIRLSPTHIYWTSAKGNVVGRANLDGTGRTELVKNAPAEPRGLALTAATLYWTEYGPTGRIMKLELPQ